MYFHKQTFTTQQFSFPHPFTTHTHELRTTGDELFAFERPKRRGQLFTSDSPDPTPNQIDFYTCHRYKKSDNYCTKFHHQHNKNPFEAHIFVPPQRSFSIIRPADYHIQFCAVSSLNGLVGSLFT